MNQAAQYLVDSYHINIGVGDGAVHVLFERTVQNGAEQLQLLRLVLIDNGYGTSALGSDGTSRMDHIHPTFAQITERYNGLFKFHVVVVTHWDEDHFFGIYTLIDKLLEQEIEAGVVTPANIANWRCPLFYYADDGSPQTVMIAPTYPMGAHGQRIGDLDIDQLDHNPYNVWYKYKGVQIQNFLRFTYGPSFLLGLNLFSGVRIPKGKASKVKSPYDLLKLNPPEQTFGDGLDMPGLYVVGVLQRVLGDPNIPLWAADLSKFKTLKNESSIAAIIMWKGADGGAPRLSHYFAGDLDDEAELRIGRFILAVPAGNPAAQCQRINTVKMSHHGATSSTNFHVLLLMKPQNIVVSNGDDHGHPRWEQLFLLHSWFMLCGGDVLASKPFFTTCYPYYLIREVLADGTSAPLYRDFKISYDLMLENMSVSTQMNVSKNYVCRMALRSMYTAINTMREANGQTKLLHIDDQFYEYIIEIDKKANADKLSDDQKAALLRQETVQWISRQVELRFKEMSPTEMESHPYFAAACKQVGFAPISTLDQIMYVRVRSENNDQDSTIATQLVGETIERLRGNKVPADPIDVPDLEEPGAMEVEMVPIQAEEDAGDQLNTFHPMMRMAAPAIRFNAMATSTTVAVRKFTQGRQLISMSPPPDWKRRSTGKEPRIGMGGAIIAKSVPTMPMGTNPDEVAPQDNVKRLSYDSIVALAKKRLPSPAPPPPAPTSGFYIYAKDVQAPSAVDKINVLTEGTFDDFVTKLTMGVIGLEGKPEADSEVPVLEDDQWRSFLQRSLGVQKLALVSDSAGSAKAFKLQLKNGDKTYKFSTEFAKNSLMPTLNTGPAPPSMPAAPSADTSPFERPGLLKEENIICFGLDPSTSQDDETLQGVFKMAGLSKIADSKIMQVISQVPVTLDGSQGARNALWFSPEDRYRTDLRLQYTQPSKNLQKLNDCLAWVTDLHVEGITMIAKRTTYNVITVTGESFSSSSEVDILVDLKVGKGVNELSVRSLFEITDNSLTLGFIFNDPGALQRILEWLTKSLGLPSVNFDEKVKSGGDNIGKPELRRVSITLALDAQGKVSGVTRFRLDVELALQLGKPDDNLPVVFFFNYQWTKTKQALRGDLWLSPPAGSAPEYIRLLPDWEEYRILQPITVKQTSEYLDLMRLFGSTSDKNVTTRPAGLPTHITQASAEIATTGISFSGIIVAERPKPGKIPQPFLGRVSLEAFWNWHSEAKLAIEVMAGLVPRVGSPYPPAELRGLLSYSAGSWTLKASVENLYGGVFYEFFDSKEQGSAIMDLIEHLRIEKLEAVYEYDKAVNAPGDSQQLAATKSFSFTGSIWFGDILLGLEFKNPRTEGQGWTFSAKLSTDIQGGQKDTTLGSLMDSLAGSTAKDLPSFLRDIKFSKPTGDKFSLGLQVSAPTKQTTTFVAHVNIDFLKFVFVQHKTVPETTTPGGNAAASVQKGVKRILKCSVKSLPKLDIPLLGDMVQPFDEMYFLWVQDTTPVPKAGKAPALGITKSELAELNKQLETINDKIYFKATKDVNKVDPDAILISPGWHFVLVAKPVKGEPEVLIDYVIGQKQDKKSQTPVPVPSPNNDGNAKPPPIGANYDKAKLPVPDPKDSASNAKGDAQMAAVKKKQGPISIENVGFKFKDGVLSIVMDAKFLLGPIGFDLLGFSIGMNFGKRKDGSSVTLHDIRAEDFSINLDGLSVSFDQPPVTLAGQYIHVIEGNLEYYAGGIIVGFQPWLFQAAGFFGKTGGADPYKSVFVFLKLDGPLVTIGFAEISGVTGAFGYNMDIRYPSISEVKDFPFVGSHPNKAPKDQLRSLLDQGPKGWIKPKKDSLWLAAGMKVDAFQVLSVDAVVVLNFSPSIKLGLFGIAVCDIPNSKAPKKFAHVELGMLAVIDPAAGYMKLEAQLSPSSFILDPSCHLTGGFALYYWWTPQNQLEGGQSGHAGDWVFTLGGYHPAYQIPDHYPRPERLQISWSLGDTLSITGQAYFAITPKCCMGGGRLHAALHRGPLSAWFDAYVDLLVNYEPFHFTADGGISVGVQFKQDLLLATLDISCEIKAQLHIEGPPVHGFVKIDFYIMDFEVEFGKKSDAIGAIKLVDFYNLVLQTNTGVPSSSTATEAAHTYSCLVGALSTTKKETPKITDPWHVKGGKLKLLVNARFAITSAKINGKSYNSMPSGTDLYSRPMWLDNKLESDLDITIKFEGSMDTHAWIISHEAKPMPKALWEQYREKDDPIRSGNNVQDLLKGDNPSMVVTTGITLKAPVASPSPDIYEKFNAADAMHEYIYQPNDPERAFFPDPAEASSTGWLAQERDEPKLWKEVPEMWKAGGSWKNVKATDPWALFADALAWDTTKKDKQFGANAPEILVHDFEQLVVSPPSVVV